MTENGEIGLIMCLCRKGGNREFARAEGSSLRPGFKHTICSLKCIKVSSVFSSSPRVKALWYSTFVINKCQHDITTNAGLLVCLQTASQIHGIGCVARGRFCCTIRSHEALESQICTHRNSPVNRTARPQSA